VITLDKSITSHSTHIVPVIPRKMTISHVVAFILLLLQSATAFVLSHHPASQAQLFMSKNSDRARVEKHLEDLMDNDWRVFRAKLVAEEQLEGQEAVTKQPGTRGNAEVSSDSRDEKQARQDKLGHIFAAIFNSNQKKENEAKKNSSSIFIGDNIGGATPDSVFPSECQDPFVSEAEIPVLLQPKVMINKHRWAHPISHIEPGCILVANEKLGGVFHHTVVLIIDHNEANGSTGIVINK